MTCECIKTLDVLIKTLLLLLLLFSSGLTGISVGCTYAAIRTQNLLAYSFSTGVSFFTISGMFFGEFPLSASCCLFTFKAKSGHSSLSKGLVMF